MLFLGLFIHPQRLFLRPQTFRPLQLLDFVVIPFHHGELVDLLRCFEVRIGMWLGDAGDVFSGGARGVGIELVLLK